MEGGKRGTLPELGVRAPLPPLGATTEENKGQSKKGGILL